LSWAFASVTGILSWCNRWGSEHCAKKLHTIERDQFERLSSSEFKCRFLNDIFKAIIEKDNSTTRFWFQWQREETSFLVSRMPCLLAVSNCFVEVWTLKCKLFFVFIFTSLRSFLFLILKMWTYKSVFIDMHDNSQSICLQFVYYIIACGLPTRFCTIL
jgi:hypothetical protein